MYAEDFTEKQEEKNTEVHHRHSYELYKLWPLVIQQPHGIHIMTCQQSSLTSVETPLKLEGKGFFI